LCLNLLLVYLGFSYLVHPFKFDMRIKFAIAGAASVLLSVGANAQALQKPVVSKAVSAAMQTASADGIKASITYLADDKLLGRKPGEPGFKMAADYVIGEVEKLWR
jgi:hypothetical protein